MQIIYFWLLRRVSYNLFLPFDLFTATIYHPEEDEEDSEVSVASSEEEEDESDEESEEEESEEETEDKIESGGNETQERY